MGSSLQEQFAEIRSLLQQEPSEDRFWAVIKLVLDAELADEAACAATLVPYVLDHIERWRAVTPHALVSEVDSWGWNSEDPLSVYGPLGERALTQGSALLPALRDLSCYEPNAATPLAARIAERRLTGLRALRAHKVHDASALIEAICAPGALPQLDALSLSGAIPLDSHMCEALLGSPILAQLRALELQGALEEAQLIAMAQRPAHAGLQHLGLEHLTLNARSMGALFTGEGLRGLESLAFGTTTLPEDSFDTLSGLDTLPALRSLSLIGCGMDEARMVALSRWAGLARLDKLALAMNDVEGPALETLLRSPDAARLRALDISSNDLDSDSFTPALAAMLTQLEVFIGWGNQLDEDAIEALATQRWPALRHLDLSINELDGEQLRSLLTTPHLRPALEKLELSHNMVGDEGLALLWAHIPPALRELRMFSTELTMDSARLLAQSPASRQLTTLWVEGNPFGEEGMALLRASANTAHLFADTKFG
jgi:alpha-D-ribose 1-methylphosphonate 5-triphosphate synthase subunit PhnH